jgi:hypothetical protein
MRQAAQRDPKVESKWIWRTVSMVRLLLRKSHINSDNFASIRPDSQGGLGSVKS